MTDLVLPAAAPAQSAGRNLAERALRRVGPALLAYAVVRLLGLAALAVWASAAGKSPHTLLSARWDSLWYTRIAEHGYGYTVHSANGGIHSDLAFFPLLPGLERLLSDIGPLHPADAGLAVSALSSLLAAWAIFAIGDRLHGARTGTVLTVLWGVLPTGIVQSMAYTESLFTALAGWALYAVLTRRWLWAAGLAVLAGLTRPVGLAVVAAIWVAAAVVLLRERGAGGTWRTHWRMLLGLSVAPLGWLGYVVWVGVHTGSPTGYLDVQGRWGNGFDGGVGFAGFVWKQLSAPPFAAGIGLCAGLAVLGWLYVRCIRQGQPLPLLIYTAAVIAMTLTGAGYFGSKPRLLMPAFPLLLPVAVALARLRPVVCALVLGTVALASAVYGAFWLHGSGPP